MKRDFFRPLATVIVMSGAVALSACTTTGGPSSAASDPYEDTNRAIHAFNKAVDRNALKPVSEAYGAAVPKPVRTGVSNAVSNINEPLNFINHVLQGDILDAGTTMTRFLVNTAFGFGGLIDTAGDAGIYGNDTDFGETMAVWGIREGAYLELPLLGPSSERDFVGKVVDFAINPTWSVLDRRESLILVGATVADVVNQRHEFAAVINALYYESADSYAAARTAYLQNKARSVTGGLAEEDLEDPYAFE